jgi:ABC-2 type transport system permease protein
MMLGKVIAVGLLGITQMLAWAVLIAGGAICTLSMLNLYDALTILTDTRVLTAAVYGILYFVGGYLLFGSLYACVGAMTDKDNENQGYIALLTFIIMISFYMAQFTIDNQGSQVAVWCSYIPITSPTIGCVQAISGAMAWWEALISLIILYGCAYFSIVIAGKIYTSAMLLTGKKLSLKDLLVFIKAK